MTSATPLGPAYIVAARRTALGRPGGLHRSRRIESLAAPVVQKAKAVAGDVAGKARQAAGPAVGQAKAAAGTAGQLVGGAVAGIKDRVAGGRPSDEDPPSD